jgi:hypothetical protein
MILPYIPSCVVGATRIYSLTHQCGAPSRNNLTTKRGNGGKVDSFSDVPKKVLHGAPTKLIKRKYGSIRKLAAAIGINHVTVSRTLKGDYCGEETQKAIAKALGVSRPKLFGKAA